MPGIMPKEVLFNDGEGLDYVDLNNVQRFMHAMLLDGLVGRLMRETDVSVTATTSYCWVFGNDAAPYMGGGTREGSNMDGVIYRRVTGGTPGGDDSNTLAYFVEADEYSITHDAAASNPRWDLITVKLEQEDADAADEEARDFEDASTLAPTTQNFVKRRKVKATWLVTKGAENVSPVVPNTPIGHVRVAAYKVTPGMTTFTAEDILDFRMPLGSGFAEVHGQQGCVTALANWSYGSTTIANQTSTNGAEMVLLCPNPGGSRRLTKVQIAAGKVAGAMPTCQLARVHFIEGMDQRVSLLNLQPTFFPSATGVRFRSYDLLADLPSTPIWSNGHTAGFAAQAQITTGVAPTPGTFVLTCPSTVGIYLANGDTNGLVVQMARFQFVGGL